MSPPWSRKRHAPAPVYRRELTEEEVEAQYQQDTAEVVRLSIDTVQPMTVKYAEEWSARQSVIIVIKDDEGERPAGGTADVKREEP